MNVVAFQLGDEYYGITIDAVAEVKGVPTITPLPGQSPHFLGLVNLRGIIIPIYDLKILFSLNSSNNNTQDKRIIVTDYNNKKMGFLVDRIHSIIEYDKHLEMIDKNEQFQDSIKGIIKLDEELIMVFDIEKLQTMLGR